MRFATTLYWLVTSAAFIATASIFALSSRAVAASPAPQTTATSASQATVCPSTTATQVAGNYQISVNVDPRTAWQPRGGTVLFRVQGSNADLTGATVRVCFGWNGQTTEA